MKYNNFTNPIFAQMYANETGQTVNGYTNGHYYTMQPGNPTLTKHELYMRVLELTTPTQED
jgi:hypothetical protein